MNLAAALELGLSSPGGPCSAGGPCSPGGASTIASGSPSLDALRAAVEQAPADADRWFELGVALLHGDALDEAHDAFRKAAMLRANWDAPRLNLAAICETLGRLAPAEEWCRQAIVLSPRNVGAYFNLGQILRSQGRLDDSIASLQSAIRLDPDYAQAHWSLANSLLLAGDFARGWPEYEWRTTSGDVVIDPYPQPRWQGEPLAGKSLLVHGEQGLGDEILFASCYSDLIAQGTRCVLVCEPRLQSLFARSFPTARVVGWQRRKDRQPADIGEPVDYQIPAGSLPLFFRQQRNDFPQRTSFLVADPEQVAHWRRQLHELGPGLKVGISWQAGGQPRERAKRTMRLADWLPLLQLPGVHWVNLQYGLVDDELSALRRESGVVIHDPPDGDPLLDLDRFAAKLQALDLVISVGNATVHLAGALGVPAWVLLPKIPAWRWLAAGRTSPWYESLTLFRQTERGDWRGPLAAAQAQLAERLNCPVAPVESASTPPPAAALAPTEHPSRLIIGGATLGELVERSHRQKVAGELADAEATLRYVLAHAPRHAQALCCLADLARQTERAELAVRLYQRALGVHENAMVRLNLAEALLSLNRWKDALSECRRAVELEPAWSNAQVKLGYALHRLGDLGAAEQAYRAAIALAPQDPAALRNLALICHERGDCAAALAHCDAVLALGHSVGVLNLRGAALLGLGRRDEAVEAFEDALALAPQDPASWNNLGRAWRESGDLHAAWSCCERAWSFAGKGHPMGAEILNNLGAVLRDQHQHAAALEKFGAAAALRMHSAAAQRDYGAELESAGHKPEALACYERALQLDPGDNATRLTRSLLLLERGDFERGWAEYGSRWFSPTARPLAGAAEIPPYDGQPLAGLTLLVWGEQGLGDEIMFASCWGEALAAGARLLVVCDPRLETLFARSFPGAQVLGVPDSARADWRLPAELHADAQMAAGDFTALCRAERQQFPAPRPYLLADPDRRAQFRARLAQWGGGLKVGISWRGGLNPRDRRLRWTPLAAWSPLLELKGIEFVNLQYGANAAEITALDPALRQRLHSLDELDLDQQIDDVAALIAELDLVIAASNVNIHVAGALGTPGWALVPASGNWRWTRGTDRTLWYSSIELVRQTDPARWDEVFATLRGKLTHRAARPKPSSGAVAELVDRAAQGERRAAPSMRGMGLVEQHPLLTPESCW